MVGGHGDVNIKNIQGITTTVKSAQMVSKPNRIKSWHRTFWESHSKYARVGNYFEWEKHVRLEIDPYHNYTIHSLVVLHQTLTWVTTLCKCVGNNPQLLWITIGENHWETQQCRAFWFAKRIQNNNIVKLYCFFFCTNLLRRLKHKKRFRGVPTLRNLAKGCVRAYTIWTVEGRNKPRRRTICSTTRICAGMRFVIKREHGEVGRSSVDER